jgi:S1-C subfamily serine protease
MGIFLGQANEDGVEATEVSANGAAAKAGVEKGDRIYQINDHKITTPADIKIALMNMQPGEQVSIRVNRRRLLVGNHQLEFSFELGPQ